MEDEEGDFQQREKIRKNNDSIFLRSSKKNFKRFSKSTKRAGLSSKSSRSTQRMASLATMPTNLREINQNKSAATTSDDDLKYCPLCQLPFRFYVGLSTQSHVEECLSNKETATELCPNDINCDAVLPQHFKKYSHPLLASLRCQDLTKSQGTQGRLHTLQVEDTHNNMFDGLGASLGTTPSTCIAWDEKEIRDTNESRGSQSSDKENAKSFSKSPDNAMKLDSTCRSDFIAPHNSCNFIPSNPARSFAVQSLTDQSPDAQSPISTTSYTASSDWLNASIDLSESQKIMPTSCKVAFPAHKLAFINGAEHSGSDEAKIPKKQMDIAAYFGIRPAQCKVNVKTNIYSKVNVKNIKVAGENMSNNKSAKESNLQQKRKCPFYKIVEGTSFAVDAFCYGHVTDITAYFLSHFHYDHYRGLNKSFSRPIYCSQITANLVTLKIKVPSSFLHPLPLNSPTVINDVEVTLLDANHCPGAVLFLFKLRNGVVHLHTGDFRASSAMQEIPSIKQCSIHTLYLDTTYCDAKYSFPDQRDVISYCAKIAVESVKKNPKTLIVVGTYTIGKEKIFLAIANALSSKVAVQRDKFNVLRCLQDEQLNKRITLDYEQARIHVLPMGSLTIPKLLGHLNTHQPKYTDLLAFKPTGWTYRDSYENDLGKIQPVKRKGLALYGVPYSEHSSFRELKEFVQFLRPHKIIPTVNIGSAKNREEMQHVFKAWLEN